MISRNKDFDRRSARSPRRSRSRIAPQKAVLISGFLGFSAAGMALAEGFTVPGGAAGAPQVPAHFKGLVNDYSATVVNGAPVKGAPYEIHGEWTLDLNWRGGATFSAEMTMETADFVNSDPNLDPGKLGAHTHHISVTDGMLDADSTAWTTLCPAYSSAVTGGFVVTGHAYITGNGGNVPFGNPSPVTICILGGTPTGTAGAAYVKFSNFELMFGPQASGHFGPQPIHGVVTHCDAPWNPGSHDCEVTVEH